MGMGWSKEDLGKAHILIESSFGDSHPGSTHLKRLCEETARGTTEVGARPACFYTTDICDGIAQGHEGMRYSLLSRELITGMVEVHARTQGMDAMVLVSSCDKSIPAHLMAAARVNMPSIHLPGGSMAIGAGGKMMGDVASAFFRLKGKKISSQEFYTISRDACPGCGACQFMGTASTMQVLSEGMGMALPNTALAPAEGAEILRNSVLTGRAIVQLEKSGITSRDIISKEAIVNAITIHAAIGGSTNAALHIPAIAAEAGITGVTAMSFDPIHRVTPFLANIHESGKYPSIFFWYAGGTYRVIELLQDTLDMGCLTVTGKTLQENLSDVKKSGFFENGEKTLAAYGLRWSDVIYHPNKAITEQGAIAILKGNLAPNGSVVKQTGVNMKRHTGSAVVFDRESEACEAILNGRIKQGSVIVIRFHGPAACGMPEMYLTTKALISQQALRDNCVLITDGRFSGASKGPAIGHVSPEAAKGGPIGKVQNGDIIEVDIEKRSLNMVGTKNKRLAPEEVEKILDKRDIAQNTFKHPNGILPLFCSLAGEANTGAIMGGMPVIV